MRYINYVARGEYPAGFSKEEKRSLRVKVEARGTQKELGRKFLAKDGLFLNVLFYVDKRPDDTVPVNVFPPKCVPPAIM